MRMQHMIDMLYVCVLVTDVHCICTAYSELLKTALC